MTRPAPRATVALSRRMVLSGLVATSLAAALPRPLRAQGAGALLVAMSDLHSPYARLPALLAEVRKIRAEAGATPVIVAINGDIFERGNAVSLRSGGAADWAFVAALAAEGPLVINLGNHETAILDDMASFVARAEGLGATVIGNLVDARTGRFFAPVQARVGAGGLTVGFLGLAPDNPFVFRAPVRPTLTLLDPVAFAADAIGPAMAGTGAQVLLSHAGVTADRAILPGLPQDTFVLGAHDHLDFLDTSVRPYLHAASWGTRLAVVTLGGAPGITLRDIAPGGGDPALAEQIAGLKAEHLTAEETAVLAELSVARDLPASILLATEAVRAAAEADIGLLGHTTFGAALAAGPLTRHDFDAFVRFDGDIQVAEVPGSRLPAILSRANQHRAATLDARTGDYVHATELAIDAARSYRIAVNGWVAQNQQSYLGTDDLAFAPVPDLQLKAVVAQALARAG